MATSPVSSTSKQMLVSLLQPYAWMSQSLQEQAEPESILVPATVVTSQAAAAAAREQVLLEHMPVVRFVARKIHERLPQHVELDDLVSAGVVGLIDAFSKFDGAKNVQFRSYAQFRIRGAILDSLRSLDWGSRELRRKGRNIGEAVQKLVQRLGRTPSESEIATELGMALDQYQELLGELKSLEIGSLNETRSEDSAEEELAYLPTAPEEDPLYRCMKREMSVHLTAAIAALPERESRVLALYYVEEMTLKEIGVVLGLVESRVSQIRLAAVNGLRLRLARDGKYPELRPRGELQAGSKSKKPLIPSAVIERSAASARQVGRARMQIR